MSECGLSDNFSSKSHLAILRAGLFWLCSGNAVGLLLATLIAWPWLGDYLGQMTYGRWVALHLDFQLYGWCSLPLLGMLYIYYLPEASWDSVAPRLMIWIWNFCLAFGGFWTLLGHSSGKIFLEWESISATLFLLLLVLLWIFLSYYFWRRSVRSAHEFANRLVWAVKFAILLVLLSVPVAFYFALSPDTFPPINTASSGATGSSLLISSLAIVFLMLLFADSTGRSTLRAKSLRPYIYGLLILHICGWTLLNHGNSSNYDLDQEIGLASFAMWLLLLKYYFLAFHWSQTSMLWLRGLFFWSLLLVPTAILMFLPGMLETAKFSSYLVAHVHLAMAGVCSCFLMALLSVLPHGTAAGVVLGNRRVFLLWNISLFIHLVSLLWLGAHEAEHFGLFLAILPGDNFGYLLRVFSGCLMLAASLNWFIRSLLAEEVEDE